MQLFIHQILVKFIIFIVLLTGCKTSTVEHLNKYELKKLKINEHTIIDVFMAQSPLEQAKGLSDIELEDFPKKTGMFFTGETQRKRQFWMPNTLFDLDIFFLSKDLYVIDIHRRLKAYKGFEPREKIPRSKEVECVHVLELPSESKESSLIKHGMVLSFTEKD